MYVVCWLGQALLLQSGTPSRWKREAPQRDDTQTCVPDHVEPKVSRILFFTQKKAWLCRLAGLYDKDWTTSNTNLDLKLFLDQYPVQEKLISSLGCRSRIAQVFSECKRSRWSQSVTFSSGNFGEMFELPHRGIFLRHWSLEIREKSWRLHKISPFDVILKEKEQLLHFNRRLVQFAESWRRINFVFQKTIGLWEHFRTIDLFFVWRDQNVDWWRDRDFFRPNDLILRPRLF